MSAILLTVAIGVAISFLVADLRALLLALCRRTVVLAAWLVPESERSRCAEEWQANLLIIEERPLSVVALTLCTVARAPGRAARVRKAERTRQKQAEGRGATELPAAEALLRRRRLDRQSAVPLYFQLAEMLKQSLREAGLVPGTRFATERQLEEEFQVSRAVIRRALDLLVADGSIARIRGTGSFVTPPKLMVPARGLIAALIDRPAELDLTIISVREHPADYAQARSLGLAGDAPLLTHVIAALAIDGRPLCLIDSRSPSGRVPWLLAATRALQAEAAPPKVPRLRLAAAQVSIESSQLGQWEASQLGASTGDPAILGRLTQAGRVGWSSRKPLELTHLICPSDRAQLVIDPD